MVSDATVEAKDVGDFIEVGNKLALLVGINEYVDSVISRLNFSVNDIEGFYEILADSEKGKYDKGNIRILSDSRNEKPTRNNILSKLTTMSRSVNPEDSILFYFSGHGYEKNGKSYLLCSDSYTNTLEETAIPIELIRKTMENSLARIKIIVLDACHSGAIKGIKDSGIMTKQFFETFFPAPEGFVVLTSCKQGECSFEWNEKGHGVFSYYLLEGLSGNADRDRDGIITITDAHAYTSENVKRWAFKKGLEQNPTLEAKISGDIPLVYIEKALEKIEPIDKSVVTEIVLTTQSLEDPSALVKRMCGYLLQFFDADRIQKSGGRYEFPYGVIIPRWRYSEEKHIDIHFTYKKENWSKIDEIIDNLGSKYNLTSIRYKMTKRIDIASLVKKCKENAFEVLSFEPLKGKESITVGTDGWLHTHTVFKNEKASSEICISSRRTSTFPNDFYSTLSPENIIEFLKDCLE